MENVKQIKTLNELRAEILKETAMEGVKPYSDNLVSILLRRVAEDFGSAEAMSGSLYGGGTYGSFLEFILIYMNS